jgi:hypothetical protein
MARTVRATAGFSEREHLQTLQLRAGRLGVDAAPDLTIRRAKAAVKNADLGFINNDNLGDSLLAIRG